MAEQNDHVDAVESDNEDETKSKYIPPAQKTVEELLKTDQEDESLKKYKEALGLSGSVIVDENDPRQVIVKKIGLLADDRQEVVLDLSDIDSIKKKPFVIKEGCKYRLKIYFYTQREIVSGLKYIQRSFRKGIKVDKTEIMLGSYPPKKDLQEYMTPVEEAPHGMLARGTYNIKSMFIDDDKKEHVNWEWTLEIKKDWKD